MTRGDIEVLVCERYDRRLVGGRWQRIHQEDLCQALAVHPSMKYQAAGGPGIAKIAALLRGLAAPDRQQSARRFFDALVYNVLIGATDAHAKNYSLLLGPASRAQLGPLYDVATVLPYDQRPDHTSAMKIGSTWQMRKVTRQDWGAVATALGLPVEQAMERVTALRAAVPKALHRAAREDTVPEPLRQQAIRIADLVTAHVENRRASFAVLDPTASSPTTGGGSTDPGR
ncbi:Serine/threonine-protein kinase HipA [Streptomonospora litoralis]|uniref:Serine/threonine-protein kinase HipA n=2 Tax=Streptomonospora litoralis TaxID=2498135 RepID=A0A4P6Q4M4_9ACTN|nr:Serine/threonine-protein kinase HipA [Streptomonospora litoralis]